MQEVKAHGGYTLSEKFRNELKYLCTEGQLAILEARLKGLMQKDKHVGPNGTYQISSLYFDDVDDRCYWENEDGCDPREKYRIRIYNNNAEKITLECKRKERDRVAKKSCPLTLEQYQQVIEGKIPWNEDLPFLLKRMAVLQRTSGMAPKVIVSYERTPWVYRNGNVRVTFDRNITSGNQVAEFLKNGGARRPLLPIGMQLLEVKFDEYLPDAIYHALVMSNMQRTSFSKYALCRKYSLKPMTKG